MLPTYTGFCSVYAFLTSVHTCFSVNPMIAAGSPMLLSFDTKLSSI
jgi:hypothetical protein